MHTILRRAFFFGVSHLVVEERRGANHAKVGVMLLAADTRRDSGTSRHLSEEVVVYAALLCRQLYFRACVEVLRSSGTHLELLSSIHLHHH